MAGKHLASYLKDHLAGSAVGLELTSYIEKTHGSVASEARQLHDEIDADREELERLMDRLSISTSLIRQTSAWLSEKMVRWKVRLEDPGAGAFHLMESAEALSLGIEGKKSMWLALSTASASNPHLLGIDFDRLIERAKDQRDRVETIRHKAALQAFSNH